MIPEDDSDESDSDLEDEEEDDGEEIIGGDFNEEVRSFSQFRRKKKYLIFFSLETILGARLWSR